LAPASENQVSPANLISPDPESENPVSRANGITPGPDQAAAASRLDSAAASLRKRYDLQGTRLRWRSDGAQQCSWMMWTGDVAAARTALLVQQWAQADARWQDDLPRIIQALVDVQVNGHWNTTVANAWAVIALRRFAQTAEVTPVTGTSTATLATQSVECTWPDPAPTLLSAYRRRLVEGVIEQLALASAMWKEWRLVLLRIRSYCAAVSLGLGRSA